MYFKNPAFKFQNWRLYDQIGRHAKTIYQIGSKNNYWIEWCRILFILG